MADYRYRKLGYLALNVTDLDRSTAFYRDMVGLSVTEEQPGEIALLRCTDQHHEIVLYPAETAGVKRMAFQMESSEDLDAAGEALRVLGIAVETVDESEARALHLNKAIRYRVPGAELPIELYDEMTEAPSPQQTVTNITRLGHIVLQAKEWESTYSWLVDHANFRISDFVDGQTAFLRPFPNPLHHSLALGKSKTTHLHHFMFMVSDIDDVGCAVNRFNNSGVPITFGPGRHVASTSIFLYFNDPDGMTVEYSFGMERFDEYSPRAPRQLEASLKTVDSWGGAPSPDYAKAGEIVGAAV